MTGTTTGRIVITARARPNAEPNYRWRALASASDDGSLWEVAACGPDEETARTKADTLIRGHLHRARPGHEWTTERSEG